MNIKKKLLVILRAIKQFGLDPIIFFNSLYNIPFYLKCYYKFRSKYKGKISLYPCLNDRKKEAGAINNEYFWQDLLVSRWIFSDNPKKHVDIGSRLDGFIAHLATFREVEIFDIRPITQKIPNVIFKKADLASKVIINDHEKNNYCDSLSCLHALEHFGLGRYGDKIDPKSYILGIENMAKFLKPNGKFYLSTPIGEERVEFNANWIFNPKKIIQIALNNNLILSKLSIFSYEHGMLDINVNEVILNKLEKQKYNLGIFVFIKKSI